ncbi:sensor histidine kinase [Acutalibacter intestini]|uniref:sensor histidine kinase n=1 Tax=Acutalibacter intestini TaxID=3093659 RepID=UPI002AC8C098|nr:sensor histidine kinase [Acutalibacter sp. M00204]
MVLLGAGAWGLFLLYGLPWEPLFYCFLLTGLLGVGLFLIPDFVRYYRTWIQLEALRRLAPKLLQPVEPCGPLHQQLMMETLETLRLRVEDLEAQQTHRQDDLIEYYTLWVHQIKTPLAAMRLILQSEPVPCGEALRQELFKTERYVDMVLGYLRIYSMSADLQLEECAVRPIAARAVKMFAPQFIYKHLSFELGDFDNRVITDKKWLLFVLEQLISNAVKYTKTGRISIDMDQENVLVLRDTGVGIDPADLPRVFERGFTGRLGRQERRSTGLGLYLSKRVMEKLHNRIEVQSEPGVGTTVRLYLDRPKAAKD